MNHIINWVLQINGTFLFHINHINHINKHGNLDFIHSFRIFLWIFELHLVLKLTVYLCNKLPASSLEWISKTNTSTMMWKQGERYNLIRSDKKLWMNELTNWYASISALHICENKNSDLFSLYAYQFWGQY
jgi:hypothetical protein